MDEKEKQGKVYFISDRENIKIGFTKGKIKYRLQQLNTGSVNNLFILGYISGDEELESYLHKKFGAFRIRQNAEWFYGSQTIIDYINQFNELNNKYIEKDQYTGKIMVYTTMDLVK